MKSLVYKIILALIALTTIVFGVLYFCDGKNSIYLTIAVIFALTISVLQIAEIVFKLFMKKRKSKQKNERVR